MSTTCKFVLLKHLSSGCEDSLGAYFTGTLVCSQKAAGDLFYTVFTVGISFELRQLETLRAFLAETVQDLIFYFLFLLMTLIMSELSFDAFFLFDETKFFR